MAARAPASLIPKCGACGFFKHCDSPKMEVGGQGKRKILIIGGYPKDKEDEKGKHFVDDDGQFLQRQLNRYGIDMRQDCWLTNALICKPTSKKIDNRTIDYCQPNLIRTINKLKPEIIIPLGQEAVSSLIGWLWKDSPGSVNRWVGWNIPSQQLNAWVCPMWHPAGIVRPNNKQRELQELIFLQHLRTAVKHDGRPWNDGSPDYKKRVEIIHDHRAAAARLDAIRNRGGIVSFDYETNMLKPDSTDARIVSCGVCWEGKETIAYPWHGKAIKATSRLLQSDCQKVGSNIKFEERWTLKEFDHPVKNWVFDDMLGSHALDSRHEITSVKFQSFVLLGFESYDDHIKPFLKAVKGAESINRILSEIDLSDLLLYNGLDALVEFLIAKRQRKQLKLT